MAHRSKHFSASDQQCRSRQPGRQSVKLVLLAIEDRYGTNGCSWPGQDELAAFAGVQVRAVRYALKWLEASGILVIERQRRHDKTINSYCIMFGTLNDYNAGVTGNQGAGYKSQETGNGGQGNRQRGTG